MALGFLFIVLNHFITASEFFHWFTLVALGSSLLIRSSVCLEIFPISLFVGFISLHVGLFLKLSLWSFSVIYAGFSAMTSILSAILGYWRWFVLLGLFYP